MPSSKACMLATFAAFSVACSSTYPRHEAADPVGLARSFAPTPAAAVRLRVAPMLQSEGCAKRGYYTRLALRPHDLQGPAALDDASTLAPLAGDLGDVRSANTYVTGDELDALESAWWLPTELPLRLGFFEACHRWARNLETIEESARRGMLTALPLVEASLDDLRLRAGRGGAAEIRDVRCYVGPRTLFHNTRPRLWCEGVAIRR